MHVAGVIAGRELISIMYTCVLLGALYVFTNASILPYPSRLSSLATFSISLLIVFIISWLVVGFLVSVAGVMFCPCPARNFSSSDSTSCDDIVCDGSNIWYCMLPC